MESPQNPYQSPNPGAPGAPQMPPQQPSAIPKVFGILHIIYASLGGLLALLGLGGGALMKAVFDPVKEQAETAGKDVEPLVEAVDSLMTISMIQSVIAIGFAVLLLIAGIKLLKYQQSGRKLSNMWAVARIVVAIPLTFMAINAQTKFQEELQKLSETTTPDMGAMMGAGGVLGVLLVSIYPVLSLIFVNQAKAQAALK